MSEGETWSTIEAPHLPGLTPEALEASLADFSLPLLQNRDWRWLSLALTRALYIARVPTSMGSDRKSEVEIRKEMNDLAEKSRSAWIALFQRSLEVDDRIFSYLFKKSGQDNALKARENFRLISQKIDSAISDLDWLSGILTRTALSIDAQGPNWNRALDRDVRVSIAYFIAPVFENAFGSRPTANNWPSPLAKSGPTAFMQFFQIVVGLAMQEHGTPNLSGVVKKALAEHRRSPVEYAPGVMP